MGKKLVIKGADFSANGFTYEIVKKEVTALYDKNGNAVAMGDTVASSSSRYFYEKTETGALSEGSALVGTASTSSGLSGTFVTVEDYTDAEVTTTNSFGPSGVIAGVAVMFFLDSTKKILGGFSTGDSIKGCTNVGTSLSERTLSMKVPAGSVYVVCTVYNNGGTIPYFKLTLSKKIMG